MSATEHNVTVYRYDGQSADRHMVPLKYVVNPRWDYDAKCSCGWETATGGATHSYVTVEVQMHTQIEQSVRS